MDLLSVINSRFGISIGLAIGRLIPNRIGYLLARKIAGSISSREDSAMVRSARLNQWVVSGERLSSDELNQVAEETIANTARFQYDLYHNLYNPPGLLDMMRFTPEAEAVIDRCKEPNEGQLVVGLHMSSLDIAYLSLGLLGVRVYAISVSNPGGGYQMLNDLRKQYGFDLIPASKNAIRQALNLLSEGKTVITGIDRPIPVMKFRPKFFNRPAALPVHHILLAVKSKKPIYITANIFQDGKYLLDTCGPIYMKEFSDRRTETLWNAEAILERAEDFIRKAPQQWSMYYPVWPDIQDLVP
jgi:lauroyl/myristoyl acyltransferase